MPEQLIVCVHLLYFEYSYIFGATLVFYIV